MTALELPQEIACILDKKKAKDIKAIYIRDLTILADYFVICTGTSTTQVKALADEVEYQLKTKFDRMPARVEGYHSSSWILADYGNVVVHFFLEDTRDFYSLERLWTDGQPVEPAELFAKVEEEETK